MVSGIPEGPGVLDSTPQQLRRRVARRTRAVGLPDDVMAIGIGALLVSLTQSSSPSCHYLDGGQRGWDDPNGHKPVAFIRRRRVERDADLARRVSEIVAETVMHRLHRMPDVGRVEQVHQHALPVPSTRPLELRNRRSSCHQASSVRKMAVPWF